VVLLLIESRPLERRSFKLSVPFGFRLQRWELELSDTAAQSCVSLFLLAGLLVFASALQVPTASTVACRTSHSQGVAPRLDLPASRWVAWIVSVVSIPLGALWLGGFSSRRDSASRLRRVQKCKTMIYCQTHPGAAGGQQAAGLGVCKLPAPGGTAAGCLLAWLLPGTAPWPC